MVAGLACLASASSPPRGPDMWTWTLDMSYGGSVPIVVNRTAAPIGADHLYTLVTAADCDAPASTSFYTETGIFRVVPNFVVQWGIAADPSCTSKWSTAIKDDPVKMSNLRGTVTYADAGPNTRTTQLFINLADNSGLDGQGFAPFGTINAAGMDVVDKIYAGYGQSPSQGSITSEGNAYLKKNFPLLSYVSSTSVSDE